MKKQTARDKENFQSQALGTLVGLTVCAGAVAGAAAAAKGLLPTTPLDEAVIISSLVFNSEFDSVMVLTVSIRVKRIKRGSGSTL